MDFSYDKKNGVKIKKLNIEENNITVLLGPSGSGKTTLLNLIIGFLRTKNNAINIKNNPKIYEIGYIMQENNVYPNLSVFQNVYLSAKNYPAWVNSARLNAMEDVLLLLGKIKLLKTIKHKYELEINKPKQNKIKLTYLFNKFRFICSVLLLPKFVVFAHCLEHLRLKNMFKKEWKSISEKLGLSEYSNKKACLLSGGQKQRVAFAKAIIKKNKLIILDEPFSALDAKIKEQTIEWIIEIKNEYQLSIIMVTHDQQDAVKVGDKIILLNNGEVQQYSNPEELYNNPNNLFVAKFIGSPEINLINETDKYFEYIRHNNISINPSGTNRIINKKHLGDKIVYSIEYNKYTVNVLSNNNEFSIDQCVGIEFNKKDILKFDFEGKRIYE
nr:ABC transporter ATP-binding protein [Mycoplasma phocoenae]